MKKYLFLLLNLGISSNLLLELPFYAFLYIGLQIVLSFKQVEPLALAVSFFLMFLVFVIIFKIFIFKILYHFRNKSFFDLVILEEIRHNKSLRHKIYRCSTLGFV